MINTITDILVCTMLATINILFIAILHKLSILANNVKAAAGYDSK